MRDNLLTNITVFYILSVLAIIGLIISSIVLINNGSSGDGLQGIANLLWLALPITTLIIDRICAHKFGSVVVNKYEFYFIGILVITFLLNWLRLRSQK